jgi:predicted nuclease with TOPRIM domain
MGSRAGKWKTDYAELLTETRLLRSRVQQLETTKAFLEGERKYTERRIKHLEGRVEEYEQEVAQYEDDALGKDAELSSVLDWEHCVHSGMLARIKELEFQVMELHRIADSRRSANDRLRDRLGEK